MTHESINVTGSAKTGLIAHDRKFNQYTVKFHCQNEEILVCFCWLLFPSPLVIRMSGLGPSWSSGGKVED